MRRELRIDFGKLGARLHQLRLPVPARVSGGPLLSLGMAAALLLALLAVEIGYAHRVTAAEERMAAAVDYAVHHPAVEIPPRLVPAVQAWLPGFQGNETFAFLRAAQGQQKVRASQAEFDGLAAEALAAVDAHPHRRLGLVPRAPAGVGLVAHPLVHAGWVHGLATLALLVLLGPAIERRWGRPWTAGLLVAASGLGAAAFCLVEGDGDRPLVGAGAAVSALAAAALVSFRGRRLPLLDWLVPEAGLWAPVWSVAPVWVGYVALASWMGGGALPEGFQPAPTWAADLAGAASGALVALGAVRLGLVRGPAAAESARAPVGSARRFDFEAVRALRARGQVERAYALLESEVGRSARNRDAVVTFFEMSVERGDPGRAAPAMRALIAEELRRGAAPVAVGHWRTLCEHLPDPGMEPGMMARLIPLIRDEDGDEIARVALRQATAGGVERLPLALAREIAELAVDLSPPLAARAAQRALAAEGLRPDERGRLESLAARGQEPGAADPEVAEEARSKRELPKNVFYEQQDRSHFGSSGGELEELTAPGDEELLYPVQAPAPPEPAHPAPSAAPPPPQVTTALPLALTDAALVVQVKGGGRTQVPLAHVHAVAAAAVRGLASRPVVLIDLLVTGAAPGGGPRRVVRLRSDSFDPRSFAPAADSPLAALRAFVEQLARRAGAELVCPAEGAPIRVFDSLDAYAREILSAQL